MEVLESSLDVVEDGVFAIVGELIHVELEVEVRVFPE